MNLSKIGEIVENREAWRTTVHGVTKSQTRLEWLNNKTAEWRMRFLSLQGPEYSVGLMKTAPFSWSQTHACAHAHMCHRAAHTHTLTYTHTHTHTHTHTQSSAFSSHLAQGFIKYKEVSQENWLSVKLDLQKVPLKKKLYCAPVVQNFTAYNPLNTDPNSGATSETHVV